MEEIKKQFGLNIRFHRQRLGLTLEELAIKSNLSHKFLGTIERAQNNISLENILLIADALDLSPAQLFLFSNRESDEYPELEILALLTIADDTTLKLIKENAMNIINYSKNR